MADEPTEAKRAETESHLATIARIDDAVKRACGWRILVCDDEPNLTFMLESAYRKKYQIRSVNDSAQLLAAARDFRPHLILMDVFMPSRSGELLAADMQQDPELAAIPIIFFSAKVSDVKAMATGQSGRLYVYIPKTIELDELEYSIDAVLARPTEPPPPAR